MKNQKRMVEALPDAITLELENLSNKLPYRHSDSIRRRVGANGQDALSVYSNSKWYNWDRKTRAHFKLLFPDQYVKKALIGWFLDIPREDGFLDLMTYWKDDVMPAVVAAYALRDNQTLWLDGKPFTANRGEGILFTLDCLHEIKPSQDGQRWACVMYLQ